MDKLLVVFVAWLLGAPIYLPWVLSRVGIYKRWYLAPLIPPFSWRGWIQVWPLSAIFVCLPLIAYSPLSDDAFMKVWASVGVAGVVLALVMIIWTPRWAKPTWQRRLEDRYSREEINRFIHVWRQMDYDKWSQLIETEEGLKRLVEGAGGVYRSGPKSPPSSE